MGEEVSVDVADKAVSTEDFACEVEEEDTVQQHFEQDEGPSLRNGFIEVSRLEAVLATLLENKFASIKTRSTKGGPKNAARKLQRILSSSTTASSTHCKDVIHNESGHHSAQFEGDVATCAQETAGTTTKHGGKQRDRKHHHLHHHHHQHHHHHYQHKSRKRYSDNEYDRSPSHGRHTRRGRSHHRATSSSPGSPHRKREFYNVEDVCEVYVECEDPRLSEQNTSRVGQYSTVQRQFSEEACTCSNMQEGHTSCCVAGNSTQIKIHYDEDYVSLNMEEFGAIDDEAIVPQEMTSPQITRKHRRRRKKRRRKRHHHHHHHITMTAETTERVKVVDPDDLPQRARWTIVATACLLLVMCLLLVGVTLRMAPIIDEMVRKENEELMHSLNRDYTYAQQNISQPSIVVRNGTGP